jgi:hypothetical protein
MQSLQKLRANRRITTWLMLFGLLFSGQLFCIMGANAAPVDSNVDHHANHPCCADAEEIKTTHISCCETPGSFCCGDAKTTASSIDFKLPQVLLLFSVFDSWLQPFVDSLQQIRNWSVDITLHRSDSPIHLVNCSFLY